MSFLDSLENNLKALESQEERDPERVARNRKRQEDERAKALAAAPYAEQLRNGPFTATLLNECVRIGHSLRTKINIAWMEGVLRLQARDHRLELRPEADGVVAHYFVNEEEARTEAIDLSSSPELLAKNWLDTLSL